MHPASAQAISISILRLKFSLILWQPCPLFFQNPFFFNLIAPRASLHPSLPGLLYKSSISQLANA